MRRAGLALLAAVAITTPAVARAETNTDAPAPGDYFLEVLINGQSTKLISQFNLNSDGGLSVSAEDLEANGLKPPGRRGHADSVDLATLPGVRYHIDVPNQRLLIEASEAARIPQRLSATTGESVVDDMTTSGTGALLNYALYAASDDVVDWSGAHFQGVAGTFEGRIFSPYGTLSQSFLSSVGGGAQGFVRLQTTYTYSDPRRMITGRAGDFVTGGLPWTRPLYLAGLQFQRNFALREDLVTTPSPVVRGSAAVPSTLELYAHNAQIYSSDLAAGPYELNNLPAIAGGGDARIVLRDPYGRETVSSVPFFASARMLRRGLLDFSIETGFARRGYGSSTTDYYPEPLASGSIRYGAGEALTLSGHAEGGAGLVGLGGGGTVGLGGVGAISAATAVSQSGRGAGVIGYGAIELEPRAGYVFYATWQRASAHYVDLAAATVATPQASGAEWIDTGAMRSLIQASLGAPIAASGGSVNLTFAALETRGSPKARTLGLSYSQSLPHRLSLSFTGYADLNAGRRGAFLGLAMPLGSDRTLSTGLEHTDEGVAASVAFTKSGSGEPGSVSYALRDREGARSLRQAYFAYRGTAAQVSAELLQQGGHTRLAGQADGSLVFADGSLFAANRIQDAFAVVRTGAADVDVLRENRSVGKTNRRGQLLVPDLRGFTTNRLAIDPTGLPPDAEVATTFKTVAPPADSGVVVAFNVEERTAAALVTLVDATGLPLPPGLSVTLNGEADAALVGYDGQVYLHKLKPANTVAVMLDDGRACRADFSFAARRGEQVSVKGARCL